MGGREVVARSVKTPTDPLASFHPIVREWFTETLGAPSPPQVQGWPVIASGNHALILAPTGTGKTLAAFLWELNALIVEGLTSPLTNGVHLLYVSPLKALNNDIQRNLDRPLIDLRRRFEQAGLAFPDVRVAVRTGDTPASQRQKMIRKSPHILITTPESLNILLTSLRGRGMFASTRTVILDEIHAVAGTKRGAHLAATMERLVELTTRPDGPQRIGLSATQRPLEEIARFLGGTDRTVSIVDCGLAKELQLCVRSPVPDLAKVDGSVWPSVAQLVLDETRSARTTLVFVNNRAQAERIAARVNALAEEEIAQPYHGSIARERRLALEHRLKAGELRALITTSSLELGIDIGTVDLVIQLQSPKRVSAALQRVGRAGHALGVPSRGVFVPTFRDDAMETAAIIAAMRAGEVEPTHVVQNALDVLAQVIVAAVSVDDWDVDALYALIRRAYPYHALPRAAYDEVVAMLSGKYPSEVAAELEARISFDRQANRLTGSRASRMTAVISGGTIPDRGLYTVNLVDRTRLGELDEEFVHESRVGDVFQLGSSTWRIAEIGHDRVVVLPAPGAPARMPFWHGEYSARSVALSARVGELRRELVSGVTDDELRVRYDCDDATINTLRRYVESQRLATGIVPDDRNIVVEHFRDETGSVRVVIHAAFGGRVNAPWAMALAHRARESLGGVDVQVQTTDDGIMLRMPELGTLPPVHALTGMTAAEAEQLVMEEIGASSLFGARFRMNAGRALLLPRGMPNRRMPLWLQRLKALDLLQTVREFPSFPILVETYREVLQDAFDIDSLKEVLRAIEEKRIAIHYVQTDVPSPFAASLQFGFVMDWLYGDDTPRAEQRAALLSLDRAMLDEVMGNVEHDDETLKALWEIVERRKPQLDAATDPARASDYGAGEGGRRGLLAKFIALGGPVTVEEIHDRYGWPMRWIEATLNEWRKRGRVVTGRFRPEISSTEFLSRRTAEIARRRALAALRKQIEAVEIPSFAAFLARWQHADPRDQVDGAGGTDTVLQQLYGLSRPAAGWERDYLKSRVRDYNAALLSEVMTSGQTVWVGETSADDATSALTLSRIRFLLRGTGGVWLPPSDGFAQDRMSANARIVYDYIASEGASFITDLKIGLSMTSLSLHESLHELVALGVVTNDTADALRQIARWKPLPGAPAYDPARWLPTAFVAGERPMRARPNVRRLPKWRRPDRPGRSGVTTGWSGRWSLVRKPGVMGAALDPEDHGAAIARAWLERYGVVSRDWWRRERPPVSWRTIYQELKRLEFRGEVRRGYFVRGLAGAQFALPDAVERLREVAGSDATAAPFVVIAASDPANPYTLALDGIDRDPLARPRGSGALLVMRAGRVALAVEGRGKRIVAADWLSPTEATDARHALAAHLRGERGARYLT
ncbi:MAG: DEAD/DEAH box helicase [Gemmatimonadota bacterium]|nr:DEAD/DEAH box helicase [Gemmatimonadota bacterium]